MLRLSSPADATANDVRRLGENGANDSALSKVPGRYTCVITLNHGEFNVIITGILLMYDSTLTSKECVVIKHNSTGCERSMLFLPKKMEFYSE